MKFKDVFKLIMGIHEQCGDKNGWENCREEAKYAYEKFPSYDQWYNHLYTRTDLSDDAKWMFEEQSESFKVLFAIKRDNVLNDKLEPTLQLMKEMGEALEHYEACHYDLRGYPCSHDKTASEALEKYRKFKEGLR